MKNKKMKLPITCQECGKQYFVEVYFEDFQKYMEGTLVQDAFPYLKPEERELLISRICPTCWDKMFNLDDEE